MEFYGVLYVPVLTAVIYWLLSFTTLWDRYYISSLQIRTLRQRSKKLTKSIFWWQRWDLKPGRLTSDYTHTHTHTQPLSIRFLISFDKHLINTFRLQLLQLVSQRNRDKHYTAFINTLRLLSITSEHIRRSIYHNCVSLSHTLLLAYSPSTQLSCEFIFSCHGQTQIFAFVTFA